MRVLGLSTGEMPKVPTLRQAIKARLNLPPTNLVTLIFKPNKFPTISLVCEEKFRVNIREDEPLYRDLLEMFEELVRDDVALFVQIPEGSEGRFILCLDEESNTEWETFDWGFKAAKHVKAKKRTGKEPRDSTLKMV